MKCQENRHFISQLVFSYVILYVFSLVLGNIICPLYLRTRIGKIIKNNQKSGSAVKDLGCSIEDFKKYLQSKFQDGMTWENYGEWHIDHIKPLSLFNLTDKQQFLQACNYINLQPLWAEENLRKSNSY